MSNNTQPEIRFPGFTEDWEQRKAKELFIPKAEKNQPELPVLSVTQDHGVVYREQVGIDIKYDKATLKNYKVIHQGDFVISLRSFQGGFELSDKLGITSPAYTIFVPKNMDSQDNLFWKTKFKTFTFIESLKTVTFGIRDGKSISFSEFGDLKLFFPKNIEEQQKIGAFFKQLDDTIALHQRKLDLLKETKKGFLQKMFPKNGAKVPEIRFPGFTEDWEARKLIDYLDVSTQKNKDEIYDKGDVLSVSGDCGIVNQIEFQGRSFAGVSVANYGVVETGDIVYTKSPLKANPYGIIKTNKGKTGIVSTLYAVYKPKQITDPEFVQIYFEQDVRMNNYMRPLVNKGAKNDMKVSDENALKGEVMFPKLEEQRKISSYFEQLNNLITLHQRELDLLKETKKGFLQKMFV
ncbi:restriction endonuclease subunit S [Enterococcus faecium]|uniref:restriction endonuclease subunit S n=1 Tax=Enterococcus faecium TaxID=1352 RepID=UPI0021E6E43F|nr:restriction endonuclease subunit S [Enterococcus faecium]MCV3193336.1 restriction endonuclease subunit S [Enterococcus faecium]